MPRVDPVADRLADQVVGNREEPQPVAFEERLFLLDVIGLGQGAADLEVVAPAGELEAFVTEGRRLGRQDFERQIGPLAGEEGDGAGHKIFRRNV